MRKGKKTFLKSQQPKKVGNFVDTLKKSVGKSAGDVNGIGNNGKAAEMIDDMKKDVKMESM